MILVALLLHGAIIPSGVRLIPLTRGAVAMIDDEDFDLVSRYKWYCDLNYARSTAAKRETGYTGMHAVILRPPPGFTVDHVNGNGLDNRRCNIRICRQSQNSCNAKKKRWKGRYTSKYKGVTWCPYGKNWRAKLNKTNLGRFSTQEQAAYAYDIMAKAIYREFAKLNHPDLTETDRQYVFDTINRPKPKTSRYRGVHYKRGARDSYGGTWVMQICLDGRKVQEYYHSEEDAARAYNRWAIKIHGTKAILNLDL